jgi:hypothetical protein
VSTPEHDRQQQPEQRSSVKIKENAKGEPAVEVSSYTHDYHLLDAARVKAVEVYKATRADVRP